MTQHPTVCACLQIVPYTPAHKPPGSPLGPRPGPSYKFRLENNPELYYKRHPQAQSNLTERLLPSGLQANSLPAVMHN